MSGRTPYAAQRRPHSPQHPRPAEAVRRHPDRPGRTGRRAVAERPAGDLAEYLVATAYDGELAPASEKSWDVRAGGRLLQVKARLIAAGDHKSHVYSPFRSWDFDACVFLLMDAHTYDVTRAVELPVAAVRDLARETVWVKGFRITTKTPLLTQPGAVDVTPAVRHALDALGS